MLARCSSGGRDFSASTGVILDSIEQFLCESDASTLVIGEAKIDSALSAFRQGTAQSCARHVEQKTSVEVVVVTPAEWSGRKQWLVPYPCRNLTELGDCGIL